MLIFIHCLVAQKRGVLFDIIFNKGHRFRHHNSQSLALEDFAVFIIFVLIIPTRIYSC